MDWIGTSATALAVAYFASMGWGVRAHFVSDGAMPAGMKATTAVTALAFTWFLAGRWETAAGRASIAPWAVAIASAALAAALGLFWWAVAVTRAGRLTLAFSRNTPSVLVTAGPYAWIRHPFYASYILFWAAAALLSPFDAYWAVPAALTILYVAVARMEEAKFAASPLAAEYAQYRNRTAMMVPTLRDRAVTSVCDAQSPARGGRPGAATRFLDAARDGFGLRPPRGVLEIVDGQARNLRITACVLSFFGTAGIALLMSDFAAQSGTAMRVIAPSIAALYAGWFITAVTWGQRRWFTNASLVILVAQGTLWGMMVECLAEVATERQSNFVVGLAMALVSTPMLGAPFSIAFAFWFPVAIGTATAVGWDLHPANPYLYTCYICYEAFTFIGMVVINRTLLENAKAQVALKAKNATVSLLLREYEENAADWLWETDEAALLHGVGPRFAQVLARPAAAFEGRSLAHALGLDPASDPAAAELAEAMAARHTFRDCAVRVFIGGEARWWSLSGRPVDGANGRFAGYRGVGSDVTDIRRADEATRYLATHDALTGIGNRRMFHERMAEACMGAQAGPPPEPFALLTMDLDRFKEVNDDHGHEAGDQVLKIVAERLQGATRPGDTIARLGGDEFAVIMPRTGIGEAEALARRLIATVSERMRLDEAWLGVGASVGVAVFPTHGVAPAEMARHADLALYRSKASGRGTCCVFDPAFMAEFQDRAALLADLRTLIGEGAGMAVHYQPIIDLATGATLSMEALCRWRHPVRGEVPPSVFIPMAEECGLIGRLGHGVLRRACLAASSWDPSVSVSVNLSPLQLKDPGLSATVAGVLRETGLDPVRLELEVTESAWLKGDAQTREELKRLEALGVRIVLDDFGTGYSSLSTLHSFRFHGLKMDAGFTRDVERDPKAGAIVRLVAELAAELGIALTAEGIETEGQLAVLRSFGITRAQGFLLGEPAERRGSLDRHPAPSKQAAAVP